MQIYVGRGVCGSTEVVLNFRQKKRVFSFLFFSNIFCRKDSNINLEYSFESGMVYPSEGLFYIEMDQAPPGKLGLKAAIVCSAVGGEGGGS